jgi:hypothetical protein
MRTFALALLAAGASAFAPAQQVRYLVVNDGYEVSVCSQMCISLDVFQLLCRPNELPLP